MLPIILKPTAMQFAVIGNDDAAHRRVAMIQDAGGECVHVLTAEEGREYIASIVSNVIPAKAGIHIPEPVVMDPRLRGGDGVVVFIAGFDNPISRELYTLAKAKGALVNVEDKAEFCDFHVPAMVRRGDLLLTVSTSGASPRVARRVRQMLETLFPANWSEWLEEIRQKRNAWRKEGMSFEALAANTDSLLNERGWMDVDCKCSRGWK